MELIENNLFGRRDTIEEAVEYFTDVIKAMPSEDQFPMYTALNVLCNTIAKNYTLTEREQNETND